MVIATGRRVGVAVVLVRRRRPCRGPVTFRGRCTEWVDPRRTRGVLQSIHIEPARSQMSSVHEHSNVKAYQV